MKIDIETITNSDNPRTVMLALLNEAKLPSTIKILGYAMINTASDDEIQKLKAMFIKSVHYIQAKDTEGLVAYLTSCGINPNVLDMLVKYANANTNKDE